MANLQMISFLVFLAVLSICSGKVAHGQAAGCHGDLEGLITQCARYVQRPGPKMDPSQGCCNVIKSVDIPCTCKYITKDVEDIIDLGKVVHVADFCGKPLSHGMKCGSYTVP